MNTGSHKTCNVGHVDQKIGPDFVGYSTEFSKINDPGIGAGASQNHTWADFESLFTNRIVVDGFRNRIDTIKM